MSGAEMQSGACKETEFTAQVGVSVSTLGLPDEYFAIPTCHVYAVMVDARIESCGTDEHEPDCEVGLFVPSHDQNIQFPTGGFISTGDTICTGFNNGTT